MDPIIYLHALILGIVEGLTEFLPISSTGHLIVVGDLLGFNDERAKVFEIVIQLGAILAVCWEYRVRLLKVTRGLGRDTQSWLFTRNLLVAFLPAALLGLMFHSQIKQYLFNPVTVAIALIVGGVVIIVIERLNHVPRVHNVDDMTWQDALKIGLAQCLSLIPGTSRAGATIIGGLLFGLSRKAATEFSFFLAIPIMVAATGFDLYQGSDHLRIDDIGIFAVGFATAFISALLAIKGLLRFVAHHDFTAFAWYRIVFGGVVLWYFL
jgi:undecaprenyl-diphosphatase